MHTSFKLFVGGAFALTLAACGGERENDAPMVTSGSLKTALQQITTQTVLPAVDNFADQASALNNAATTFCSTVNSDNLASLQTQWKTTSAAWYRLLPFRFGPLDDDAVFPAYQYIDSYRLRGDNYVSTVRSNISQWLASADTLDHDFFDGLTFNKVGLLAIEVAAFETTDTHSTATADIVSEYNNANRKCAVLTGLTSALQEKASYVHDGWHVAYLDSNTPFLTLFENDELPDGSESMTKLITSVQEFLDYLQLRNVVTTVSPVAAEAWPLVGNSLAVIREVVAGTSATTVSLFDLMTSSGNRTAVSTVQSNLDQADTNIAAQDATSFNASAALLDGNFKRDIPDSLDVNLGINFTDGD